MSFYKLLMHTPHSQVMTSSFAKDRGKYCRHLGTSDVPLLNFYVFQSEVSARNITPLPAIIEDCDERTMFY